MRMLHTSDWHLGRTLHGADLLDAQADFCRWLVDTVDRTGVDAVLISGDVHDRAVPPTGAVRLLESTLEDLSARVPVVVVSGNHDSAIRLGYGSRLFRSGLHVATDPAGVGAPVQLGDEHGPVLVYPIPYLEPDVVRHTFSAGPTALPRSHQAAMSAAMDRIRVDRATRPRRVADAAPTRTPDRWKRISKRCWA